MKTTMKANLAAINFDAESFVKQYGETPTSGSTLGKLGVFLLNVADAQTANQRLAAKVNDAMSRMSEEDLPFASDNVKAIVSYLEGINPSDLSEIKDELRPTLDKMERTKAKTEQAAKRVGGLIQEEVLDTTLSALQKEERAGMTVKTDPYKRQEDGFLVSSDEEL